MTLNELLNIFDRDRDELVIQVCEKDDWEKFDELSSSSNIINTFLGNKKVLCASAIEEDVIRIDLEW